jgi:hypothetical protein
MKKLIIQLSGGIGNQLFQYHAGFAVANAYGATLMIDESRVSKGRYVRSNRKSGLTVSNLRGIVGVEEVFLRKGFIKDLGRVNKWKSFVPFLKHSLVDASPKGEIGVNLTIADLQRLIPEMSTVRLRGNLQSLQLVQCARERGCLPNFRPKNSSEHFFKEIEKLTSNSILGIHLRAKDYGNESNMTKLSEAYYRSAVELALKEKEGSLIWIFTDSEADAREKYDWIFDQPQTTLVNSSLFSDLETIYIMSKTDQLIISNSTFSFWGGMFNKEGKIYAPEPWFRSNGEIIGDSIRSDANLVNFNFPENWKILEW